MKQIDKLIDDVITSEKLKNTLKHFSTTALTAERGLQKDTGRREIAEVILFFSYVEEQSLLTKNIFEDLMDRFYDLRPTKDYKVNVEISEKLSKKIEILNKYDSILFLKVVDQEHEDIQYLVRTGFFPYGVTMAQLYIIDGVLEWQFEN